MSRAASALAVAVILVLAACADLPHAFEPEVASHSKLGASTSTVNEWFPVNFVVETADLPCLLEDIHVIGMVHAVMHFTEGPNGKILDRYTWNDQNVAGTGLTTGSRYRRVGATTNTIQVNAPLPVVVTFTNSWHFIGQGQAPNLLVADAFHYTVDANGRLTAEAIDNLRFECR